MEKKILLYYMSSQTTTPTPSFPTWSPMSSYSYPDEVLAAMQNQELNRSIYNGTNKVIGTINDTTRFINSEITGVSKDIAASSLGLRDAIERGNVANVLTTERVNSQLASAVERNGNAAQVTSERNAFNVTSAVDRNGNAAQVTSERTGGNIMTAIERVAGEGRLTTTITDAASRQAANDSARDILAAVERNGFTSVATTKDAHNGLLGAIERNAGENRMTTVTVGGQNDQKLANAHSSIITQMSTIEGEVLASIERNGTDTRNMSNTAAWEARTAMGTGFAASMLESSKNTAELSRQHAQIYADIMLENSKNSALLSNQGSNHYSSLLLEQQKLKEYLSSKGDTHFAMNQLEMQKVKEGLAAQAAHHFASTQLEAQKVKECLSAQLADAKYEALKSQQYIGDKIDECCCSVKEKMDVLDRDRLRDNLVVEREDNNLLKILELSDFGGYGRGRGSRGRRGGRR